MLFRSGLPIPLDLQEALERNMELVIVVILMALEVGVNLVVKVVDSLETLAEVSLVVSVVDKPVETVQV